MKSAFRQHMQNWIKNHTDPLLIAEIGGNHEGDFEYAKKLTDLAIKSGADAIKFQIYTGDTLVSSIESPQRNKHFKKFELTKEQHIELARRVLDAGKLYSASVWDIEALEWIDPYMSFYKIGSGDLTAYPVLKATALKRKPIVLSTGLASEKEVQQTIEYIESIDDFYKVYENLSILQCTSMYPIEDADANLLVMKRFKEIFNHPIGYSDHTEGTIALEAAAAMGAEILEFHFTDSREHKTFRDHKVSLTCDEVLDLKSKLKRIQAFRGSPVKTALPIEIDNGHHMSFRRAVYPLKDILKGNIVKASDLTVLRPCHGIDARDFDKVVGKKLLQDVKKHQKLYWSMFSSETLN